MNLTPDELEYFEERAAVYEFMAAMPREMAERKAHELLAVYRMSRMTGREQARELARELRQ